MAQKSPPLDDLLCGLGSDEKEAFQEILQKSPGPMRLGQQFFSDSSEDSSFSPSTSPRKSPRKFSRCDSVDCSPKCSYCMGTGRSPEECGHRMKDENGDVVCPTMLQELGPCPICGATGSKVHTARYCPTKEPVAFRLPDDYEYKR